MRIERRIEQRASKTEENLLDVPAGKENQPTSGLQQPQIPATKVGKVGAGISKKKRGDAKKSKDIPSEVPETNQAFDKLLDDLQIPVTLRPKLVGMDSTVKAAMLKSSQTMAIAPAPEPSPPPTTPHTRGLRRAHSIESFNSPQHFVAPIDYLEPPHTAGFAGTYVSALHSPYTGGTGISRQGSSHTRGLSFDAPRLFSKSQVHLPSSTSTVDVSAGSRHAKDKAPALKNLSPTKFCSILQSQSSTELDVEDIKKLRLLLRNESASWSQEFLKLGGYSALLTRLNEILEVEWREEQHDDQILHELLRCFKALSTSSIGCFALRSSCPTPFVQLVSLLYSDKKPGEVATRQLIADLLLILFELYPPSSLPSTGTKGGALLSGRSRPHREAWESESSLVTSNLISLPPPHKSFFSLIRALLLTPAPPPSERPGVPISPHAFIESLHQPRIYKTYLQELSDLCRDYFWVFCHPTNTIWILAETDEGRVEKPRAPGGMTGGVEFEAMGYFTTHLRLINSIAKCVADLNMLKDHDHSAHRFHSDLFLSGLERIILISRKASTTYYPTLHLELARYISYACRAGYELPYTVSRLIGMPPSGLSKNPELRSGRNTPARPPGTPTKRHSGAPALPSPIKVEPIHFD